MKNKKIKKKLVVLHVIEKLNEEDGGLYNIVENICRFLPKNENIVLTDQIKNLKVLKNFKCKVIWDYTILQKYKFLLSTKIHLIHIHGIWPFLNTFVAYFAIIKKIPYLVSPQGMLEPWSINEKKIKKFIFLKLVWKIIFKKASRIIFTSKQEFKNFKKLDIIRKFKNEIIPNGFFIHDYRRIKKKNKIKQLLFLSRIHKKKGIKMLVEAFTELDPDNWQLNIAGSGEKNFVNGLKKEYDLYLKNKKILFLGFKDKLKKLNVFKNSDIFVLPSYSENFGIVIPEALSFGLPVITTRATPWSEIKKKNCGWFIHPNKNALKKCLNTVFKLKNEQLIIMSKNAKKLSENYKWIKISKKIKDIYSQYI